MNVPYRYRGLLLLTLLAVLLPWAAWHYALGPTLGAWTECRRLERQFAAAPPATGPEHSAAAEGPGLVLSGALLDTVRRITGGDAVQVTGYVPVVTLAQDGAALHTAEVLLAGGFAPTLRAVGELERRCPGCRVRSLAWRSAEDRLLKRRQLVLTVYVQQIIVNK